MDVLNIEITVPPFFCNYNYVHSFKNEKSLSYY